MKNKILHITPHLGGGVGTVLLNWLTYDKSSCHSIITLDYANERGINVCKDNNIPLYSQIPVNEILQKIDESDITVIHFWNHPLLYDFIVKNPLPKSRIIIWSHVSGAKPPYVFNKKLFDICDKFVFTTPISYYFAERNPKLSCILSTGGTESFENLKKEEHQGYNAGYIGTVDFAKMHPNYAETMLRTDADKIYVVGGGSSLKDFDKNNNRFNITGKIDNVGEILKKLDVFAYLLNSNHYGTAEQVLQEAMSAGVVPVVLNNPCEASLVKHMETGLVAKNLDEYVYYINLLKEDFDLRHRLEANARIYAKEKFSLKSLTEQWNNIFNEILQIPKSEKKWDIKKDSVTSYDIFLESLGEYRSLFENSSDESIKALLQEPSWASDTKGTPKQYFDFLGGEKLKSICSLY